MRRLFKNHKLKLLILATAISFIIGVFTVEKQSNGDIYYYGFPGVFLILDKQSFWIPVNLGFNPFQFIGNVGLIWIILLYLYKAVCKFAKIVKKRRATELISKIQDKIRDINSNPNITLRQQETLIYDMIKQDYEEWHLTLRNVIAPDLSLYSQEEIVGLFQDICGVVMKHREEMRVPTEAAARAYAATSLSIYILYLISGSEDMYLNTMQQHIDNYLLP